MGKRLDGIVGKVKMCPTWVRSRDDSSATVGRIDMGSTRVGRELIGLANAVRVGGGGGARHVHCQRHFHLKNAFFGHFSGLPSVLGDYET